MTWRSDVCLITHGIPSAMIDRCLLHRRHKALFVGGLRSD
jgi:hypothetical protein